MNGQIRAREVRLVVDGQGAEVVSIDVALKKADAAELDLVEISPNATPPVVKIMDYKKFLYEQRKKKKELKSKSSKVVVKEIRFGPNTDEHDFQFKLKHAKKFIEEGAKLKAFVFFKGRTILFKDKGEILLLKLAQELSEIADVESMPKMEGKRMVVFFNPKKK
ncbi:translation initiation factor IF-3 [bacterium SCSIO 12741]|nr:translation initiation factor IF-3 [bacterium SCSIO 12741]